MHEQQEDLGQQIWVEVDDDEVDVRGNLIWPAFSGEVEDWGSLFAIAQRPKSIR
jgi:hypothetical protein